jgi:hypothetical protein
MACIHNCRMDRAAAHCPLLSVNRSGRCGCALHVDFRMRLGVTDRPPAFAGRHCCMWYSRLCVVRHVCRIAVFHAVCGNPIARWWRSLGDDYTASINQFAERCFEIRRQVSTVWLVATATYPPPQDQTNHYRAAAASPPPPRRRCAAAAAAAAAAPPLPSLQQCANLGTADSCRPFAIRRLWPPTVVRTEPRS